MIDKALSFLLGELNTYLGARFPGTEGHAVLASLSSPDGGVPTAIHNKIVLSLVNLEKETTVGAPGFVARSGSAYARTSPALYLNLYILLSASYAGSYQTAMQMLSYSMAFLQSKPTYTAENSAGFPEGMQQLTMEMVSLSMAELSTLWAVLGANYLPSVVYKMRMLTMQEGWIIEPIPAVDAVQPKIQSAP